MLKKIRKMKKRYWMLIGIVILLILIFGIQKNNQDNYNTYTVTKTTVSDKLLLAGTIDAKDRVDLGFASSGRVKKINFEVGDTVKKGQVIAEIEQNRLQSELTQAQANYLVTKVDTTTDLESAEESLEKQLLEQEVIIGGLYREYLSGDLQAYNNDSIDRSVSNPIISGSYSGAIEGEYYLDVYSSSTSSGFSFRVSGLDSKSHTAEVNQPGLLGRSGLYIQFTDGGNYANTNWVVPVPNTRSSTYISRKTAYESAVATRDRIISDLENTLDRNTSVIDGTTTRNDARRQQAQAQVSAIAAQLGDGKIRAPFDGIVAKNDLEVGEIVNAFTTEIVMFGGEQKELNLNTPEIYINKIQLGDTVNVSLDAYDDLVFTGKVDFIDFIDTEVDGVPVYRTDILIDTLDSRIRSGMNAKASIISESVEDVLAIPGHYIHTDDNTQQFVSLKTSDHPFKTEERMVTTGLQGNEGLVEILTGLKQGDIIVLLNS